MSTTRAERVQDLFAAALDLPPEQWPALLAEACGSDSELRAEVESLLQHHRHEDPDFLRPITPDVHRSADPDAPDPLIGRRIRQYIVSKTLASGGMGTVYLAEQEHPRREVAIKVMRFGLGSRAALRRFEYESQVLASLKHPGIAQVIESGTHQEEGSRLGLPYFVMEYVEGAQPITAFAGKRQHVETSKRQHENAETWKRGSAETVRTESPSLPGRGPGVGGLSTRERLTLFLQVCDAVQHGHQRGIIHRDLKPANLLVDAAGRVKVIDFGVARATDADIAATTMRTDVGQLIGTLQYMSPEQCEADASNIDVRSDVYSLGVVLYELLTGSLPYDTSGTTVFNATRTIREQAPKRPSSIDVKLRGDVETIVLKALEKERGRRYQSVEALSADIRRYLNHEPILARPIGGIESTIRFVRRHRWQFATAFGIALAVFVWIGGEFETLQAERDVARAAQEAVYPEQMLLAASLFASGDAITAERVLAETAPSRQGWEYRHLASRVNQSVETLYPPGYDDDAAEDAPLDRIVSLSVADGGGRILLSQTDPVGGPERQVLVEPGADGWRQVGAVTPESGAALLTGELVGEGGRFLVTTEHARDGSFSLLVFNAGRLADGPVARLRGGERYHRVRWLKQRNRALLADNEGSLALIDTSQIPVEPRAAPVDLRPLVTIKAHSGNVGGLAVSPDETLLVTASDDWTAKIWSVDELLALGAQVEPERVQTKAEPKFVLIGHTYKVNSAAFSPDGTRLATGSEDGTVRLWHVATGTPLAEGVLRGHVGPVRAVAFDDTGTRLVSGGVDTTLRVWDVDEDAKQADASGTTSRDMPRREMIATLRGHTDSIVWVEFDEHGAVLSASQDGRVLRWRPDLPDVPTLSGHTSSVAAVSFTADGDYAVSAGDGGVFLWDTKRTIPVARWYSGLLVVPGVAVRLIDGRELVYAMSFAAYPTRGRLLELHLLELEPDRSSEQPRLKLLHEVELGLRREGWSSLAVSEDGRRVAVGRGMGLVEIAEVEDNCRLRRLGTIELSLAENRDESAWGLAFLDRAGRWLATGTENSLDGVAPGRHPITIWDVATSQRVGQTDADSDHEGGIRALAVRHSKDGTARLLASASGDRSVKVWRVHNADGSGPPRLELLHTCLGHTDVVQAVAFHPKEQRLASGGLDRIVRLWDLDTGVEVAALRGHKGSVRALAFDLQGERLASASAGNYGTDNVVRLWETTSAREAEQAGWAAERANARRAQAEVRDIFRNRLPATVQEARRQIDALARVPNEVKAVAHASLPEVIGAPAHVYQPAVTLLEDDAEAAADPSGWKQRLADALNWTELAVEIAPRDPRCHIVHGALLLRLERPAEALESLETARSLGKPDYTAMYALLALAHADLGDMAAAGKALDDARTSLTDPWTVNGAFGLRFEPLLEEAERRLGDDAEP